MAEKKNKRGVRLLEGGDDLGRLFADEPADVEAEDDFARLLDRCLAEMDAGSIARDKEPPAAPEDTSLRERLRAYPPPQAELDLHGTTAGAAGDTTAAFLLSARRRGLRTVRVIVGKGLHSRGRPVLPDVVEQVVVELKRQRQILSFVWEKQAKRRSGALIVYLPGRQASP
jgi:DNA-nicking Smr family endonuclease